MTLQAQWLPSTRVPKPDARGLKGRDGSDGGNKQGTSSTPGRSWPWPPAPLTGAHRGHDPLDSGRGQLLALGLLHQRHAQVLEAEEHPLEQCLPSVCPVLRQLWAGRWVPQSLLGRPATATALADPIFQGDPARGIRVPPSTIIFIFRFNKELTFSSTH